MIKYNLKCENDHNFDAWFSDSSNFEKQNKKNLILCPKCSSTKTEKNIEKIIKNVRKHVEKNYEYVGNKFADEARAIHYGEKEEREIYGETSIEEAVDLIEEGVNVTPLPGIDPKIKN